MPRKTRHENIYILISVLAYAALATAYFVLPWPPALSPWWPRLLILAGVALVYEGILKLIVRRFK